MADNRTFLIVMRPAFKHIAKLGKGKGPPIRYTFAFTQGEFEPVFLIARLTGYVTTQRRFRRYEAW